MFTRLVSLGLLQGCSGSQNAFLKAHSCLGRFQLHCNSSYLLPCEEVGHVNTKLPLTFIGRIYARSREQFANPWCKRNGCKLSRELTKFHCQCRAIVTYLILFCLVCYSSKMESTCTTQIRSCCSRISKVPAKTMTSTLKWPSGLVHLSRLRGNRNCDCHNCLPPSSAFRS